MSDFSKGVRATLTAVMVAGGIAYSMVPTPPAPPPPPKCEASSEAKLMITELNDTLKKSVDGLNEAIKSCGK